MTGSHASASVEPAAGRVLLCGVNWIGDTLMSWPAVAALRRRRPSLHLTVLVKRPLMPLWNLSGLADEVMELESGVSGLLRTARRVRAAACTEAFVLPHSVRSALVPFLARIPRRTGMPGHGGRDLLLTRVIPPRGGPGRSHQAWEYVDLLLEGDPSGVRLAPRLVIPPALREQALARAGAPLAAPVVGLIPGAARGPSKCWPEAHFIAAGRRLAEDHHATVLVFGAPSEADLGRRVAEGVGPRARNLAGCTSLAEWAALLGECAVVIANDSGGMHLAAAAGAAVVALYGHTDPEKTGPLGDRVCVIQDSPVRRRDIARADPAAMAALAALSPERAVAACVPWLGDGAARRPGDPA